MDYDSTLFFFSRNLAVLVPCVFHLNLKLTCQLLWKTKHLEFNIILLNLIIDICWHSVPVLGAPRIHVLLQYFKSLWYLFPYLFLMQTLRAVSGSQQNWTEIAVSTWCPSLHLSIFQYSAVLFILSSLWHVHNVKLWDAGLQFVDSFFLSLFGSVSGTIFKFTNSFFSWVQSSYETFEDSLSGITFFLAFPFLNFIVSISLLKFSINFAYYVPFSLSFLII